MCSKDKAAYTPDSITHISQKHQHFQQKLNVSETQRQAIYTRRLCAPQKPVHTSACDLSNRGLLQTGIICFFIALQQACDTEDRHSTTCLVLVVKLSV